MSATELQEYADEYPLLTVIVPVYNSMPYLIELMDSLVEQSLDNIVYNVLLVDDGSTDDGAAVMDDYASRHANFRVLHEENSGWPGTPRNKGLERAHTKYIFFADSDDIVAPSALQLLVEYAEEHGSDIVIPQLAGIEGRKIPASKLTEPIPDLDLVAAFHTLGPIKLYRRALLEEHRIAFPAEKVRLEDGIFNARAYLAARRISVLAGEDLYYVRSRDDGQNISVQAFEPFGYTGSVAKMCRIINEASLDESTRRDIVLGLFQRKCLKIYRPGRFINYKDSRRETWVAAHRGFVEELVTEDMEDELKHPYDVRTKLVRAGDVDALLRLQGLESSPTIKGGLVSSASVGRSVEFAVDIAIEGALGVDQLVCELWSREENGHSAFPLCAVNDSAVAYAYPRRFKGTLSAGAVSGLSDGVYDLHVTRLIGKKHVSSRVAVSKETVLGGVPGIKVYATAHGNLSLKKSPAPSAAVRPASNARRWVGRRIRKGRSIVAGMRRGR